MTNKDRKKKTVCWPAELNKWQSTKLNCLWWHHINLSIRAWAPFFSCVFISVVCVQSNISCSLVGIICCVSHSHNRRVQMLNLRREFLLTANIFIIVSSFWHCSKWGIFFGSLYTVYRSQHIFHKRRAQKIYHFDWDWLLAESYSVLHSLLVLKVVDWSLALQQSGVFLIMTGHRLHVFNIILMGTLTS